MKVQKMFGWSLSVLILLFTMGTAIAENAKPFSASVSVDYFSKYVWRGQSINDESVLQTNVSGSAYGFTGSIWSNNDLTNDRKGEFSEVDYSLDYSHTLSEKIGFSLGVIHYVFPNTEFVPTTEIYGGLNFSVALSPSVKWYRDINEIDGSYIQISAGHSFDELVKWSNGCSMGVSVSASLAFAGKGYNAGYFGIEDTLMNDFTLGISVPFDLKHVTLTPRFQFSTMVDEEIGNAVSERNNVWFGMGLSKSF